MSNRSLLEFNHDHCPRNDDECLKLGRALRDYMRAADPEELPSGVIRKHYRHHSDPCPVESMPDLLSALREARTDLSILRIQIGMELNRGIDRWEGVPKNIKERLNAIDAAIASAEGRS